MTQVNKEKISRISFMPNKGALNYYMLEVLCSCLVGAGAFLILVGPRAIVPWNIAWLQGTDAVFQYLSWKFFALSAWSLPPGINQHYGLEISSSIFYSDSIPLFALIFKLFGILKNGELQY